VVFIRFFFILVKINQRFLLLNLLII